MFFDRINKIYRFFFVCDKILPKAKNPVNPVNPVKKCRYEMSTFFHPKCCEVKCKKG